MPKQAIFFILLLMGTAGINSTTAAKNAADVWSELVGKKPRKNTVFAYVKNNPTLPNVLIYGDSISIGYTQSVREKMAGRANIYRLYRNGMDSGQFVKLMKRMHKKMRDPQLENHWAFEWDVIHFNVGLHDLKYLRDGQLDKESGKQVTSPEDYAKNLEAIITYLKQLAPEAKLIFATTTPVPDKSRGRIAGDAAKYNAVARDVLKRHSEIAVNDLYALSKPNQNKWWSKPGDVHYRVQGRLAQGEAAASLIAESLTDQ